MKIFIDARMTKIGGTYTITVSLLREILKRDSSNNEYFVLYNKGQEQILPGKAENIVASLDNPIYWLYWDRFVLPKIVSKNGIDVFHSLKRPNISNIRTKKIITIPSAYPFLYPELQSLGERLYWSRVQIKAARDADAIWAFSETDKKNLSKTLQVEPQKIFAHHLATSDKFKKIADYKEMKEFSAKHNLPDKYILFVGSFYLFKNIPNIIKAFAKLKNDVDIPHKLLLVGQGGSGSKEVYSTINKLKLEKEVVFTGPITEDIPLFYAGAELFVFPTIYDSFGMPVLEAMACGIPTIVSTKGALQEVAGEAALKYDPDDVNGISEGMKQFIFDSELRESMISRGYQRVKKFSWEKCAQETIKMYGHVYDGR